MLFNSVSFLALFIGLFVLLATDRGGGWALRRAYLSMRGGQITAYLARPHRPPVLIVGNARVALNIDPARFPAGSANLAHHGTGQVFGTGLLHVLQAAHKLPPTLLLHLDPDEYAQPARPEEINQLNFYYRTKPYVAAQINALGWAGRLKNQSALYGHNARVFGLAQAWRRPGTAPDFGFPAPAVRPPRQPEHPVCEPAAGGPAGLAQPRPAAGAARVGGRVPGRARAAYLLHG